MKNLLKLLFAALLITSVTTTYATGSPGERPDSEVPCDDVNQQTGTGEVTTGDVTPGEQGGETISN